MLSSHLSGLADTLPLSGTISPSYLLFSPTYMIYATAATLEGLRRKKQLPRFLPGATNFWAWLAGDFSLDVMVVFQWQNTRVARALKLPKPSYPTSPTEIGICRRSGLPGAAPGQRSSAPLLLSFLLALGERGCRQVLEAGEFQCSIPAPLSSSPSCCVGCRAPILPGRKAGDSSALCKLLGPHRCCQAWQ